MLSDPECLFKSVAFLTTHCLFLKIPFSKDTPEPKLKGQICGVKVRERIKGLFALCCVVRCHTSDVHALHDRCVKNNLLFVEIYCYGSFLYCISGLAKLELHSIIDSCGDTRDMSSANVVRLASYMIGCETASLITIIIRMGRKQTYFVARTTEKKFK